MLKVFFLVLPFTKTEYMHAIEELTLKFCKSQDTPRVC
jgi:hypothetical protein